MRNILVIRFGALGDLCLLGWSLAALADAPDRTDRRVTLVTKDAFAPLMRQCRGVDQVIPLRGRQATALLGLAGRLGRRNWDQVLDAHGVLRSHGLLGLMGRRPVARLRKDTAQRLALLRGQRAPELDDRTMRQRFDEVFAALGTPLIPDPAPPWGHLRPVDQPQPCLGLAPGAQWETKRWPAEHFARLLQHFLDSTPHPARIFLGPREAQWFAGSPLARVAADAGHRVQLIQDQPLPRVAGLLAGCRAVVTNDSGLLHLAEAVGTPVLALFGPTVRQFGYFPGLEASLVLEHDLDCRPCSRNGKAPCHRGDLACLRDIGPDRAHDFLERTFAP